MITKQLSNEADILQAASSETAATGETVGDAFDMANREGVLILVQFGTGNAGHTVKVQGGEASDGADAADLEGTLITTTASEPYVVIEIHKPMQRYLTLVTNRAVSTTLGTAFAFRYGKRIEPGDISGAGPGVIASAIHVSPAVGTA